MRKAVSLLLVLQLFMLSLGGIKASIYYLLNKSYIAMELCVNRDKPECDGQCHLKDSIKKNAEEDASHEITFKGELLPFLAEERDIRLEVRTAISTLAFLPWQDLYSAPEHNIGHRPPPARV